jgi:Ca-activated chloride channel family protein
VAPSRLQRSAQQVRRLLQDLDGDRVGLLAFAGRSYILSPLTVDGGAVRIFVDALDPDLVSEGGTGLGLPLTQGRELLAASETPGDRVLVVFTDGETHDSVTEDVVHARQLKEAGVRLVLVAEGTTTPTRLPVRDSLGRFVDWQVDGEGQLVRSARHDEVLQSIAEAGGGTIIPADVPDQAGAVRDVLASYARGAGSDTRAQDFVPRAWMAALLAALILTAYGFLRRGLALVSLALVLAGSVTTDVEAQRPTTATRLADDGDHAKAAAAFLREAREPAAHDTALYNAGTAALRAGKYDDARTVLGEAAKTLNPDLRYRALYNAGVAALTEAKADSVRRDTLLAESEARLRAALLLSPSSPRAKWNLELAQRLKPPPPPSSGGGGKGGGTGKTPPPPTDDPVNQKQADQILESMDRAERETRLAQQRRAQGRSGGVKDW